MCLLMLMALPDIDEFSDKLRPSQFVCRLVNSQIGQLVNWPMLSTHNMLDKLILDDCSEM